MAIKRFSLTEGTIVPEENGNLIMTEDLAPLSDLVTNGLVLMSKFNANKNSEYISAIEGILFTLDTELRALK